MSMGMEKINSDLAKEVLMVLAFCDDEFVSKIPNDLISELSVLASYSSKDFYINEEKGLDDQNISDDCKDILSLLYYLYVLNDQEKEKLLGNWMSN